MSKNENRGMQVAIEKKCLSQTDALLVLTSGRTRQ